MKYTHGGDVYGSRRGMLDFSSNINPLGVCDRVRSAIVDCVDGIVKYPDPYCRELRRKIAAFHNVDEEYVVCANGAAEIIFDALRDSERVLLCAPSFTEYKRAAQAADAEIIYANDADEFFDKLQYADTAIVCNPNNPTGELIYADTLDTIIKRSSNCGVNLIIDECFLDFAEDGEQFSAVKYIDKYVNILVLKSFTKLYAFPGLRLGYAITSCERTRERIYKNRQPWSVSTLAQAAGMAALECTDIAEKTRELVSREREYMYRELRNLGIEYTPSEANYILFESFSGLDRLLEKRGILIRCCGDYEGLSDTCYRIAVRTHEENEKLFEALFDIYKKQGRV